MSPACRGSHPRYGEPASRLDRPVEPVFEVRLQGRGVPVRAQVPRPRPLFVADDPELPYTEGGTVRAVGRPRPERGIGLAVLGEDALPNLVLVPPGAHQQEVEVAPATVQDDEPD